MSKWHSDELKVIEDYIEHHKRIVKICDLEKIKNDIEVSTGKIRSLAAIKKKSIELIKIREGRTDAPAKKIKIWTQHETNLLLIKYEEGEGPNITSRINNIFQADHKKL